MNQTIAGQRLQKARTRFCDRLHRRFRRVLCRVVCELSQPLDNKVLEGVSAKVRSEAGAQLLSHARLALASSTQIKAQASLGAAGLFARNSILDKSTRTLLHAVKTAIRRQFQEYFMKLGLFEQVSRDLESGIGELDDYVSGCVHDVNVSLLALLDIDLHALLPPRKPEAPEARPEAVETRAEPAHRLVDAFGRALLMPVEQMYGVGEVDDEQVLGAQRFPRPFCGPVLEVLRSYVIGVDKYNLLNQSLLKTLNRHLNKAELTVQECRELFATPAMQKPLAGHCLHMLKILMQSTRRESLVLRMNILLSQRHPDLYLEFTYRHVSLLTKAWAHFVRQQMDFIPEGSQTAEILGAFLPAHALRDTSCK